MNEISIHDSDFVDKVTNIVMGTLHKKGRRKVLNSHLKIFRDLPKAPPEDMIVKSVIAKFLAVYKSGSHKQLSEGYILSIAKTAEWKYKIKAHVIISAINKLRKILDNQDASGIYYTGDVSFHVKDLPPPRTQLKNDKLYTGEEVCIIQNYFKSLLMNEFQLSRGFIPIPSPMIQLGLIILIAIDSAARNNQILSLTVKDLKDLEIHQVCTCKSKKGWGDDTIQVLQSTSTIIGHYLNRYFPHSSDVTFVFTRDYNKFYNLYKSVLETLFNKPYHGKKLFHGFRTFKLHDLSKIDPRLAQDYANHKSINTTKRYINNQHTSEIKLLKKSMK